MPIFEYQCNDCGEVLEIFQHDAEHHPKRCGFRCPLGPQDESEHRGMGELGRLISEVSTISRRTHDYRKPSVEDAGKAGFTVYENKGGGRVKKIAGKNEPKEIHLKE